MRACRSLRRVSVVRRSVALLLAGCLPTGGTALAQSGSSAVTRLPEITVYGARTTQTLDDVTASVGIVTDDEIERRALRGFRDSFRLLGNVRDADWTDAGFVLRGISSEGLTPGGTPLASYYVDGIQQTIQGTRRGSRGLWDTEQVEVYRGPQSTLAGRAALAGAIYVKTKDPVFRFEAAARGMGGEDELSTGAGMVNVPLIEDQVALRVAGEYQRSESALDYPTYERFDRFGDFKEDEFLSVRSKLRVQPKALPRTRVLLLYSYAEDAPDVSDIGGPVLGFAFDDDRGDFNTPIFSEVRRTTVHSGGLEVVQELTSGLLLTAQSGFSRSATERPSVNAGTAGETNVLTGDFVQHLFTQEFRLNYFGERTDATVGIYGAWEDENAGFRRPDFFGFAADVSKTDRDEWNLAGFGEVSYEFLPGWKAVLGGRVDHTDQEGSSFFSRNGTARTDFSYALSDTVVLPKVGFRKELGPHHTVGFTFQRGFRTGGAGVQRSTGCVFDFDPEYAWNYELSYTGRLFDNRLALSANVFYLDLEDQQIETLADPLDPASAFTDNAAESHAVGFELEGSGRLPFGLSGFFSVGFVETEFDTFNLAGRDLSGEAFPEAPRWNVAAGAFYQHPSGVFLGVDFEYTDDFRARIAQAPTDTLDDFFLTNVQAGYRSSWFVLKLFIDNVADRRYFLFADNDVASTLGDERLIGVSLDVFYDSPA